MVPAAVVAVDALPLTPNGKLDTRALPAPEYTAGDQYRAPANAVEEILAGIYAQVLGLERVGVDDSFFDLGGDSLSAMRLIAAINTGLDTGLGVRALFDAPSVRRLSQQLGRHASSAKGPSFASVHGRDATEVHASDLTLDKFIDAATLAAAPTLPGPSAEVRTVLLTGATGFLGRYLALEWLERMDLVDGKVICLVRAKPTPTRARRLDATFDSGDPKLLAHYRELAADHLEVIAGDKGEAEPRPGPADLAAAGRHRRPDRRPGGAGQPRAALQPAVRAQRAGHRRADPDRADHARSSRSSTCRRSACGAGIEPRQFIEDADIRVDQRHPHGRRQLRQRLRQQQVGRRGAAARGARPVRPAGRRCSAAT